MSKFINGTVLVAKQQREQAEALVQGLKEVKRVLVVAGAKGGVGNSTVTVNLALALAASGLQVGLLEAAGYGAAVPLMFGISEKTRHRDNYLQPLCQSGLTLMSPGLLNDNDQTQVGRGPSEAKAMRRLLHQVAWGALDYLLIDLPSDCRNEVLSSLHELPDCRLLLVMTPQELALASGRRALQRFRGANLRLMGLVENMSYFLCGHEIEPLEIFGIFGAGGGQKLSEESSLPLLATIPIDISLSRSGDTGVPLLIAAPESENSHIFHTLAIAVVNEFDRKSTLD